MLGLKVPFKAIQLNPHVSQMNSPRPSGLGLGMGYDQENTEIDYLQPFAAEWGMNMCCVTRALWEDRQGSRDVIEGSIPREGETCGCFGEEEKLAQ